MVKIYSEQYGCSSSLSDTQIMLGLLKKSGFEIVNDVKKSDLNLITTCSVKTPTEQRMVHRIKELTKLNKPLIVAGCLPKVKKEIIEKINPRASLIGPDSVERIVDVVRDSLHGKKVIALEDLKKPKLGLPRCRGNSAIGITQIGRGCISNCSFCGEPYRGKLFSYPPKAIVEDVKQNLKDECKEIWITSLDNSCYGFDINTNLAELLNEICKIKGKFFIRVGMMNPLHLKKILDDLVDVYKNEKIFKFLHIPVQSFSDKILKDMKRGYTVKDFISCVEKFRKEIPYLTISTDIITGYPTETEKDHELNIKFLEKLEFDVVNLSKFGVRPKTFAEKLKQLPSSVINKRSKELSIVVRNVSKKRNEKWLDWEGEVFIDELNDDFVTGRNYAYKPIVIKEKLKLGNTANVKIIDTKTNFLIGKINQQ
jgi:MiaB-like tRNA modifying enzyme